MTDRPILFSAPMVRALLDGWKTQTRRVLKPQPEFRGGAGDYHDAEEWGWEGEDGGHLSVLDIAPNGYVTGDRLWVREAWAHYQTVNHVLHSGGRAFDEVSDGLAGYKADGHDTIEHFRDHVRMMSGYDLEHVVIDGERWRSSIHMPRWASRLTLTVTDVRVQRLQNISEGDAQAEGICQCEPAEPRDGMRYFGLPGVDGYRPTAIKGFRDLWNRLNDKRGYCWDANPWVAAVSFTVKQRNIDALTDEMEGG